MPAPANDNFANATSLALAGTLAGDNTDATSDGANDPLVNDSYGVHTIWYVITPTNPGLLTIGTTASGGSPIVDSVIGVYQGTTLAGLVELDVDDDSGPGNYSQITNLSVSAGDPIYIEVTGYDDSSFGSFTLTWSYAECLSAVDILNPDSSTASVVSGRVRESWDLFWDYGATIYTVPEKTFKFTWAGVAGAYTMTATGRAASTASRGAALLVIQINGRLFVGSATSTSVRNSATSTTWSVVKGFDSGSNPLIYERSDYAQVPWLILTPGDEVTIMVASDMDTSPFSAMIPFDCESLCFQLDPNAPTTTYCTGSVEFEDKPLGDEWGSPHDWGGQMLIPDEIWPHISVTPYDEADYSWVENYSDNDMVVVPNGNVYVLIKEAVPSPGSDTNPASYANNNNQYTYLAVKKYDADTDTWTQVATLNIFNPINGAGHAVGCLAGPHFIDSANAYYDPIGGFIYFAWIEDVFFVNSFPNVLSKAFVAKFDPSNDTYTVLGNGVAAYTAQNLGNYERGSALGVNIAVTTNGDVYIGAVEVDLASIPGSSRRRPFVWRWDGATWTNINLPAPSTTSDNNWQIDGENQYWDQLVMLIPNRRDGSQDGITAYWQSIDWNTPDPFTERYQGVTIEYTPGGGWQNEILTDWSTISPMPNWANGGSSFPTDFILRTFDPTILWSETYGRLLLAADMFSLGNEEIWMMWQMNDAGTQWEQITGTELAPPSSAMTWRQSRNSAEIGPDGVIYRGLMSDEGVNFDSRPNIVKHSPGFGINYADACRVHIGEQDTYVDRQGQNWQGVNLSMYGTSNLRIRWMGNKVYMLANMFAEPLNGDDMPDWPVGEGFFVFRGSYMPCSNFVFGSIKFP